MPNNLPYTMDMYRKDLEKMMRNPMATGSPVPQSQMPTVMDNLRKAATSITGLLTSGTTLAGTSL